MSKKEDKDDKGGFTKGLLAGIGAALGIAAIGIGGKLLYDKYIENKTPDEEIEQKKENINEKKENLENSNNLDTTNSISTNIEDTDLEGKDSFICPINQTLMNDPVITPYGTTYERSAILNWLKKNNTDPLTKKRLTKEMLITNYALRSAIQEYKESLNK